MVTRLWLSRLKNQLITSLSLVYLAAPFIKRDIDRARKSNAPIY